MVSALLQAAFNGLLIFLAGSASYHAWRLRQRVAALEALAVKQAELNEPRNGYARPRPAGPPGLP